MTDLGRRWIIAREKQSQVVGPQVNDRSITSNTGKGTERIWEYVHRHRPTAGRGSEAWGRWGQRLARRDAVVCSPSQARRTESPEQETMIMMVEVGMRWCYGSRGRPVVAPRESSSPPQASCKSQAATQGLIVEDGETCQRERVTSGVDACSARKKGPTGKHRLSNIILLYV